MLTMGKTHSNYTQVGTRNVHDVNVMYIVSMVMCTKQPIHITHDRHGCERMVSIYS
jgi:hypothetical protein